jgi:hypothetical protein
MSRFYTKAMAETKWVAPVRSMSQGAPALKRNISWIELKSRCFTGFAGYRCGASRAVFHSFRNPSWQWFKGKAFSLALRISTAKTSANLPA